MILRLPFSIQELKNFLYEKYGADAQFLYMIIDTMAWFQRLHKYKTIRISYRLMKALIKYKYGFNFRIKKMHYNVKILIEEGVIEQVASGERDMHKRIANGYEFKNWQHPQGAQAKEDFLDSLFPKDTIKDLLLKNCEG